MAIVKQGKGDGKTLEVHSNFAKLGAQYKCSRCGRSCAASSAREVVSKLCPTCRNESR